MDSFPPRLIPDATRPALRPGREPTRLGPALAVAASGHAILAALLLWAGTQAEPAVPESPDAVQMVFAEAPAVSEPPSPVQDTPLKAISEPPTAETPPEPPVETPPIAEPPPDAPTPVLLEPPPPSPPEPSPAEPIAPEPPAPPPTPAAPPPAPVLPRHPPPLPKPRPAPPSRPQAAQPAPAVGPVPATPVPAPVPAATAGIDLAWRGALNGWLAARRRYPELARQREEEGVVGVTFIVDRDGRVLEVAITRPSGSSLLDDAVRDMLRGGRVPSFPASMPQAQASVTVNIRYTLEHWR